jgi:hypothetical protein
MELRNIMSCNRRQRRSARLQVVARGDLAASGSLLFRLKITSERSCQTRQSPMNGLDAATRNRAHGQFVSFQYQR